MGNRPAAGLALIHELAKAVELLSLISSLIACLLELRHPQSLIEHMQSPLAKLESVCKYPRSQALWGSAVYLGGWD